MKKTYRICAGLFALLLLGLTWGFSAQTGAESGALSAKIAKALMRFLGIEQTADRLDRAVYIVRKAAHFNLFALIGLSLGLAFAIPNKPTCVFWALPIAIFCASADEVHQHFVAGRAAMWQDVLLDSCGALTGVSAVFLFMKLRKRRKR